MTRAFNFKFDYLLWFLILAPTFYISGTDTRTMQLEFFKIAVIAGLAFFHANRYIGLFLGYLLFQFIFFKSNVADPSVIPNIFFAAVLYHLIVRYAKISKAYIWAFYGVLLLSVFWIPIQMAQADPVWGMANNHIQNVFTEYSGWFSLPAFLGNYAAAVLPLAFLLTPLLIPFALVALFFSKSSFSIIAALFGTLFYLWFAKRILFWIVLLVFGTIGIFYVVKYDLPYGQFERRANVWQVVVKQSFQKQFFGHGVGAYGGRYQFFEFSPSLHNAMITNNKQFLDFIASEVELRGENELVGQIAKIQPDNLNAPLVSQLRAILQSKGMDYHEWMPAHNEFLQVFFDLGLVGLLIIGAYVFDIFKRFALYADTELSLALMASFIAILIMSFAHFPFQIARLAGPFIVLLSFLDLSLRKNDTG